jgi:hypothetical protein
VSTLATPHQGATRKAPQQHKLTEVWITHTRGLETSEEHSADTVPFERKIHSQNSPTMPPKRKSAVATRQPGRRTTRSEQRAVDNGGSSSGAESGPRLDPFARMNGDIVNLILDCLSLPDLACCECVSKSWRDTIHWWVAAFGFRVHFPHIILGLQRRSDPAIREAFKVLGRYLFSVLYIPFDAPIPT